MEDCPTITQSSMQRLLCADKRIMQLPNVISMMIIFGQLVIPIEAGDSITKFPSEKIQHSDFFAAGIVSGCLLKVDMKAVGKHLFA